MSKRPASTGGKGSGSGHALFGANGGGPGHAKLSSVPKGTGIAVNGITVRRRFNGPGGARKVSAANRVAGGSRVIGGVKGGTKIRGSARTGVVHTGINARTNRNANIAAVATVAAGVAITHPKGTIKVAKATGRGAGKAARGTGRLGKSAARAVGGRVYKRDWHGRFAS